jgi:outer membrane immunogenic protein
MKYKSLVLSSLGVLPGVAGGIHIAPANAQPATAQDRVFSWTGYYVGAHLGGIWDKSDASANLPGSGTSNYCWNFDCSFKNKQTASGIMGGAQIGYNFQTGNIVFGVEADISATSAKKTATRGSDATYDWSASRTGIDALGTARLRLGYAFDRSLFYATGGLAYGKVRNTHQSYQTTYSWSERTGWQAGWTLGGGLEYALAPNWSLKVEGLYYDLGKQNHVSTDGFGSAFGLSDRTTGAVVRAGLNYLFR